MTPLASAHEAIRRPVSQPPRTLWHTGNLLAWSHIDGPTDFSHGLVARTVEGGIDVRLPALARIRFAEGIVSATVASDWFESFGANGSVIRGAMLDARHLLIEGAASFDSASEAVAGVAGKNRLLVGGASRFNRSLIDADLDEAIRDRRRWQAGLRLPDSADDLSPGAQTALSRALSQMKGQLCSPEGAILHPWTTPDRWPHRSMWLWDSAFHAIGWRHLDPALARSMLDAVLDCAAPDGFIPHMMGPAWRSAITQPPILAFAALLVFEKEPDLAWLARAYPKLCAYVRWDAAHRDTDGGGLVEWFIQAEHDCRSGESGMDNSPRFDAALLLDAPDFNAYLASEYEALADIAEKLGLVADIAQWSARHASLCELINTRLWSREHRLYLDFDPRAGRHSPVLSCAGLLPLFCGAPDDARARDLAAHLSNPATFGTALPIPSVAACDTERYSKDMWRGPAWVNINWFVARGLRRYGLHAEADRLRALTLAELERTCARYGTFFEYFDDRREVEPPFLLRKRKNVPGQHPHQSIHDYGWSATLYLDWLLSP